VIPSDLSFGYLSAELKSPVKIPIPDKKSRTPDVSFRLASERVRLSQHITVRQSGQAVAPTLERGRFIFAHHPKMDSIPTWHRTVPVAEAR
jgi:hypothetical protein